MIEPDLAAVEQMASDLEHAAAMGHAMMPTVRIEGQPGFRSRYGAFCRACGATLIVYLGTPAAQAWGGADLPCRGSV